MSVSTQALHWYKRGCRLTRLGICWGIRFAWVKMALLLHPWQVQERTVSLKRVCLQGFDTFRLDESSLGVGGRGGMFFSLVLFCSWGGGGGGGPFHCLLTSFFLFVFFHFFFNSLPCHGWLDVKKQFPSCLYYIVNDPLWVKSYQTVTRNLP